MPLLNPYKVGPPVAGSDFYGRTKLISRVYQALGKSNVVLLQGQRRIGKTSFLKHLATYLEKPYLNSQPVEYVTVLFDIQRYIQDRLPQFQMHLAETIAGKFQLEVPKLVEWQADHNLFQNNWLPQVYKQLGNRVLVFLIDEFDNLEEKIAPQALQTLIPFLGQLVSAENKLKWILASGRQSGKLPLQFDPIVGQAIQFRISFLSVAETRELIEKPAYGSLVYQQEAIERIYQFTNGQPHLTQAMGSELFQLALEEEKETITAQDVDAVVSQTLETYSGAIASIVRSSPIEERILAAIAELTVPGKTTDLNQIIQLLLENNVQLNRDDLTNALNSLIQWELIAANGLEIHIVVELVRLWLRQNVTVKPTQEEELDIDVFIAESRCETAKKIF